MLKLFFIIFVVACTIFLYRSIETNNLGDPKPCHADRHEHCDIDGYVGSRVIYEDQEIRIWNFTLAPGEMSSMHVHDLDYSYVAVQPSQLEIFGENGDILFNFRAEGVFVFKI